jgi:hypothetical protein
VRAVIFRFNNRGTWQSGIVRSGAVGDALVDRVEAADTGGRSFRQVLDGFPCFAAVCCVVQKDTNVLAGRGNRAHVSNPGDCAKPSDLTVGPGHASQIWKAGKIRCKEKLRSPVGPSVFRLGDESTAVHKPSGQFVEEPDVVGS